MNLESSWIERFYTHFLGRDFAYLFAGGLFICIVKYALYGNIFPPPKINFELIGFLSASYFLGMIIRDLGVRISPSLDFDFDKRTDKYKSYHVFSQELAENCSEIINLYERNTYFLLAETSTGCSSLFGGIFMILVALYRWFFKGVSYSENYIWLTISFISFGLITLIFLASHQARNIEKESEALIAFINEKKETNRQRSKKDMP